MTKAHILVVKEVYGSSLLFISLSQIYIKCAFLWDISVSNKNGY